MTRVIFENQVARYYGSLCTVCISYIVLFAALVDVDTAAANQSQASQKSYLRLCSHHSHSQSKVRKSSVEQDTNRHVVFFASVTLTLI